MHMTAEIEASGPLQKQSIPAIAERSSINAGPRNTMRASALATTSPVATIMTNLGAAFCCMRSNLTADCLPLN